MFYYSKDCVSYTFYLYIVVHSIENLSNIVSNTDIKEFVKGYNSNILSKSYMINYMNKPAKIETDPIDDYLECVTYCSISSDTEENDCQTICMERHLKSMYF